MNADRAAGGEFGGDAPGIRDRVPETQVHSVLLVRFHSRHRKAIETTTTDEDANAIKNAVTGGIPDSSLDASARRRSSL
jgi:hypothetical protein